MSLAMYHEEDSNDLSDLGIGTSSGKSSVSGDTHDDTQSVLVSLFIVIIIMALIVNLDLVSTIFLFLLCSMNLVFIVLKIKKTF